MLIRLLNTGGAPLPRISGRWLVPGEPSAITHDIVMTFYVDRVDGEWTPVVHLQAPGAHSDLQVPAEHLVDLSAWGQHSGEFRSLRILPRAIEFDGSEKPKRLLVELIGEVNRARVIRP